MNWALFAGCVTAIMFAVWLFLLVRSRRSITSVYVSFAFLLLAGMNSAAPIRGFVDPDYVGYGFGMLRADKGLPVTLMAGTVFLASLACALIAVRNRRGAAMWIVAIVCAAFTIIEGWPWLRNVVSNPESNMIQFGEYLTIPGLVGSALLGALLVVPFLIGLPWAARLAMASERARS